jgi:hypothetical protein
MGTILPIVDVLVLLGLVVSISRAVWNGQRQGSSPLALPAIIVIALIVFAIVSFCAASGLAERSPLNQLALLVFLILIAVVASASWAKA